VRAVAHVALLSEIFPVCCDCDGSASLTIEEPLLDASGGCEEKESAAEVERRVVSLEVAKDATDVSAESELMAAI
jgi:hypothetical protein